MARKVKKVEQLCIIKLCQETELLKHARVAICPVLLCYVPCVFQQPCRVLAVYYYAAGRAFIIGATQHSHLSFERKEPVYL